MNNTTTNTTTVYVATVSTRYEVAAVDTTADGAITKACELALEWLREQGVTEFGNADEVREHFGVGAYAVPVGSAVLVHLAHAAR